MFDPNPNWRNHRWSYDADYCDRADAPLLAHLIGKFGFMFDDVFIYIFRGKVKQYIIRFPHHGLKRMNYRVPTEKPKDPFQLKLDVADKPRGS